MMCYKDQSYCSSKVTKHTCGREFTEQDAKDAEKWWGGKDYPVAYGDFCKNPNAVSLGSLGGRAKTEKKAEAARENGKKGGRPKKAKPEYTSGWEQHLAEQKEGRRIEKEEGMNPA